MLKSSQRTARFGTRAKLVLALGAALFAIVLGELFVRVAGLAPEVKALWLSRDNSDDLVYMRSTNPILGFELKPNFRNEEADLNVSLPRTNSHGQRDIERSIEKPSEARRIILLGDSVVEGHGLREIDDTMSRQLELLDADESTEVLNFGVSGYCTRSEVELLEVKGLQFDPDIVVVVFTENDFQDFNPEALQVDDVIERPEFVKRLFLVSHLYRLPSIHFNWYQFGAETDPVAWNQQAIGENNVVQGLERLTQLRNEHGFQTLIAVWPRFTDDAIEDLHFMPDSNELIIERLGDLYDISVTRLSHGFREQLAVDPKATNPRLVYTIGDSIHPSAAGNKVAAELLRVMLSKVDDADASPPSTSDVDRSAGLAAIDAALRAGKPAENADAVAYAIRYNNRGQQLEEQGKLAEAKEQYLLALEADPNHAASLHNLGVLALQSGQAREAQRYFESALRVEPDMEEAHLNLGMLLAKAGDVKLAMHHFTEVLRINPQSTKGHFNLGALFVNHGDARTAEHHFRNVIDIDPTYVNALFQLGDLKLRQDELTAAQEWYALTLKNDPEHAQAHNHLGVALAQQGRLTVARQHFAEATRIAPGLAEARANLTRIEQQINNQSDR